MLSTVLVIPCYNEAKRFPVARIDQFLEQNPNISLILANDGSRDETVQVLQRLQNGHPHRIRILDRAVNRGKAETVREGMLAGLDGSSPPEVLGYWDADLATPLEAVFDMVSLLETQPALQMVFGARVNLLGRQIRRRATRHYLGRIFATVVSTMLGMPIYDTQCGAKLFRVGPALRELYEEPFSSRWVFDVEIIARWIRVNRFDREQVKQTIYEYPLHAWEDVGGSKVKPYDFILAFFDILRIYRRYFLKRPPVAQL
ncbi:MAG: glycosyltransferase [Acidobacteriota bacterium]